MLFLWRGDSSLAEYKQGKFYDDDPELLGQLWKRSESHCLMWCDASLAIQQQVCVWGRHCCPPRKASVVVVMCSYGSLIVDKLLQPAG